jgi:DedD protein
VKERLTGAAILVALIVLLVPELLRGPFHTVAHPVAASDEAPPLRSYTIKLGDDAHGAAAPAASGPQQPAPISSAPETQQAQAEPAAPPVTEPAPAATRPVPAPAPVEHAASAPPVPAETAGSGAYMVQLGSFASRDNAERLAKQVRSQGFTVSVARGTTGRHLYKVLVGPAHDRAAAAQLEVKLHAVGHSGSVVAR